MINRIALSATQVALCSEIIKYFTAKPIGENGVTQEEHDRYAKGLLRRVELREAHEKLRNHTSCPYFITKNTMAKASKKEGSSLYNLQKFIDHAAKHPPAADDATETPAPKKKAAKAKKGAAPKKEAAKPKKGKKTPAEPVAAGETMNETVAEPAAAIE
jgi:hypothetical protein